MSHFVRSQSKPGCVPPLAQWPRARLPSFCFFRKEHLIFSVNTLQTKWGRGASVGHELCKLKPIIFCLLLSLLRQVGVGYPEAHRGVHEIVPKASGMPVSQSSFKVTPPAHVHSWIKSPNSYSAPSTQKTHESSVVMRGGYPAGPTAENNYLHVASKAERPVSQSGSLSARRREAGVNKPAGVSRQPLSSSTFGNEFGKNR